MCRGTISEPRGVDKDVQVSGSLSGHPNTSSVYVNKNRDCHDNQAGPVMAEDPTSTSALSQNGSSFTAEGHPVFYNNGQKKTGLQLGIDQSFCTGPGQGGED